jgi:hypothetical protein
MDAEEKRGISYLCWESNADTLVFQFVVKSLYLLSYPGFKCPT